MTEPRKQKLQGNHILFIRVSARTTNIFQSLDLTVDSSFISLVKKKFTWWYSKEIDKQLDEGVAIENIEIKLQISSYYRLAGLRKNTNIWNEISSWQKKIAGITEAISKDLEGLHTLDSFHLIDPLVQSSNEIIHLLIWNLKKHSTLPTMMMMMMMMMMMKVRLITGKLRKLVNVFEIYLTYMEIRYHIFQVFVL